jgi:hypothetical protein
MAVSRIRSRHYSNPSTIRNQVTSLRGGASVLAAGSGGGCLRVINSLPKTFPFAAAFFTCALKAGVADLMAQVGERRKIEKSKVNENDQKGNPLKRKTTQIQYRRTLAFLLYGGIYQGCFQEFTMNIAYPIVFGVNNDAITIIKKVAFHMLIESPILCLPAAYVAKAGVTGQSMKEAIGQYVDDVKNKGLLNKYWALWTPVNCLVFAKIPKHLRVSFIACVSFFWTFALSSISSRSEDLQLSETEVSSSSSSSSSALPEPQMAELPLFPEKKIVEASIHLQSSDNEKNEIEA